MPYALLVLGSGGRGESLLAAEQDNALVYEATTRRASSMGGLPALANTLPGSSMSGVHYCADGVMARIPLGVAVWIRGVIACAIGAGIQIERVPSTRI